MLVCKEPDVALTVAILVRNCAADLYRLAPRLRALLDQQGMSYEIIIVDLASTDGADRAVDTTGVRYIKLPTAEYGAAVMRAAAEARGMHLATIEPGSPDLPQLVIALWAARDKGDVIIASRFAPEGRSGSGLLRRVLSRSLNRVFAAGLSIPVHDLSCGLRLYHRRVFQGLDAVFSSYVFLVEVLLKAFARGMDIHEMPYRHVPARREASLRRLAGFALEYCALFWKVWRVRNSIEFPDYDWRAHDSRIPLQRYWQRRRRRIILDFTPAFVSTLDVGCGTSRILADLPHAVGLDRRRDKLAFMRRTNPLLVQGDGLRLPFRDDQFECIVCSQVIEHIPDEGGRLLDELTRVLRPGGILVLGTPDYATWQWPLIEWLYGKVTPGAYADEHVTRYTNATLRAALTARGHEILDQAYICRAELVMRARKIGEKLPSPAC